MKKVSVIIPTYNRAQYLPQAIESVLDQTISGVEIVVVDDGSTDDTKTAIKPYAEKIQYIYTENAGPAHARNVGIQNATGDYIAFLDSDDIYYPYKLELQASALDKFIDIGMVYSEFTGFSDAGFFDEFHIRNYHGSAYKTAGLTYEIIYPKKRAFEQVGLNSDKWPNGNVYIGHIFDWYFNHIIVFTNSIMLRKSIIDKVGLLNEKYFLFDDLDFALRICKHFPVGFIDIPTYKLRYHGEQISGIYKDTGIFVTIEKQRNLIEIAENIALKDDVYYSSHQEFVNRRMAILHKAVAIPLMAKGKKPEEARFHLRKCMAYGYREPLLMTITYLPYLVRRLILKSLVLLKAV